MTRCRTWWIGVALLCAATFGLRAQDDPTDSPDEPALERDTESSNAESSDTESSDAATVAQLPSRFFPANLHHLKWQPIEPESTSTETESATAPLFDALRSYDRANGNGAVAQSPLVLSDGSRLADLGLNDPRANQRGIDLPLNSNLQISGYKSITVQYNHTKYFGREGLQRYYGDTLGGSRFSTGYNGLDFGNSYDSYGGGLGGYNSYGGGYDSYGSGGYGSSYGGGYGGLGGYGGGLGGYGSRADGLNIQQELQIGIHGRVGDHTHVAVDYSDANRGNFSGLDQKQQRIAVWYEGDEDSIIKRAAFGDITLELPNARFLQVNRNLFGAQIIAELGGIRATAFGSRTKGLKGKWRSQGQTQRAGSGTGRQIPDTSFVKERYYAIHLGEDGFLHDAYLPIRPGSVQIF
ncbi:MAG: hypothetical protein O3A46_12595, partial [Candidatus Poribacteria bacterium]|nr:hypothetical protein [Candidatus Poribacteria bacterium]